MFTSFPIAIAPKIIPSAARATPVTIINDLAPVAISLLFFSICLISVISACTTAPDASNTPAAGSISSFFANLAINTDPNIIDSAANTAPEANNRFLAPTEIVVFLPFTIFKSFIKEAVTIPVATRTPAALYTSFSSRINLDIPIAAATISSALANAPAAIAKFICASSKLFLCFLAIFATPSIANIIPPIPIIAAANDAGEDSSNNLPKLIAPNNSNSAPAITAPIVIKSFLELYNSFALFEAMVAICVYPRIIADVAVNPYIICGHASSAT